MIRVKNEKKFKVLENDRLTNEDTTVRLNLLSFFFFYYKSVGKPKNTKRKHCDKKDKMFKNYNVAACKLKNDKDN